MNILLRLKALSGLNDLAAFLGYTPTGLAYILYKGPLGGRYSSFNIPKRSGGTRAIYAPDKRLKALQATLAGRLHECQIETRKQKTRPDNLTHGFEKGRSIITNAWRHKRRRYVLNIDLEDFFPSINFGRVRGFFIKNREFSLHPDVATVIAQISCFQNSLPQGAPSSPIVSNLLAHSMDVRLAQLAKSHQSTYSRYADDLTFSSNNSVFSTELAYEHLGKVGGWALGDTLLSEITRSGFSVQASKTRMQRRPGQQIVTGLVVNDKVNIRASYYRAARAMCDSLFKTGHYYKGALSSKTLLPASSSKKENAIVYLEGVMAHIYHVKHESDIRSGRLQTKHEAEEAKRLRYPAYRGVYKKLLYFKHFVGIDKPLVVCEGKTDNIYLRSALKNLASAYPTLAKVENGKLIMNVRLLKHSRVEHDILELSGGSANLASLVARYEAAVFRYKHRPLLHPVIVLIDNDSGSDGVMGALRKRKIKITKLTDNVYYHVCLNLYVIKTPEFGPSGDSCIETLFPSSICSIKLDGKSFSLEKDLDLTTQYGKFDFADKVIRPNYASIDFSGFKPLFDRILAVINDYKT